MKYVRFTELISRCVEWFRYLFFNDFVVKLIKIKIEKIQYSFGPCLGNVIFSEKFCVHTGTAEKVTMMQFSCRAISLCCCLFSWWNHDHQKRKTHYKDLKWVCMETTRFDFYFGDYQANKSLEKVDWDSWHYGDKCFIVPRLANVKVGRIFAEAAFS